MSIIRFPFALDSPGFQPYVVRRGVDMLAVLRALAARRAPATLYFGGPDDLLYSEIIGLNPAFEELLFAPGSDQGKFERLLAGGAFGVETSLESIRILFMTNHAEATLFQGVTALRARIPDTITRLQRRESMRIATPQDKPSFCTARVGANPVRELRMRVVDVSIGGLGLALADADPAIEPGQTLSDCDLELPGLGTVHCTLQILHVKDVQAGRPEQRVGCRFQDLPVLSREQVRSYAARLERAQLAAQAERKP